ncbi:hypothetical protein AWM70_11780 [Paenibacillus yonginensis]|uniref:ROK family protein n=1 Tax=Paenibacillus yonginensis TaxID=1462996 RepID=A0A1B1N185_9BACL|nr:ROK family protein [Paenibacillus yonginensis]ANS75197.1 hypothetical protein AWM70_11780 [Paenibacillus yonginensis]
MSAYTVGIDLGGTNIKTAVFDGNGQIVRERSDQTDAAKGPSHVLNKIKHIIRQMLKELEADDTNVSCRGHMNMYREGRPCRCGSSGCLGRYVSAVGMVNTFTERLEQGKTSIVQSWVGSSIRRSPPG